MQTYKTKKNLRRCKANKTSCKLKNQKEPLRKNTTKLANGFVRQIQFHANTQNKQMLTELFRK
jgi:hypothetical protein